MGKKLGRYFHTCNITDGGCGMPFTTDRPYARKCPNCADASRNAGLMKLKNYWRTARA